MIKLLPRYAGQALPATAEFPFGTPKNDDVPGDRLGTPWELAILKDIFGSYAALAQAAGITPNDVPDTALSSQIFDSFANAAWYQYGNYKPGTLTSRGDRLFLAIDTSGPDTGDAVDPTVANNGKFVAAIPNSSNAITDNVKIVPIIQIDATPRTITAPVEISRGWDVVLTLLQATYIDGEYAAQSGVMTKVIPKTGALEFYDVSELTASVAGKDQLPSTAGVTLSDLGTEFSLSINFQQVETGVFTAKIEIGDQATKHDVVGATTVQLTAVPIGVPFPWPTDIAPDGYAIMKGQAFDTVLYPATAAAYPSGILDDMRGLAVVGKKDGETVLAYEADDNKSHGHVGTATSANLGVKTTSGAGNHRHIQGLYWEGIAGTFRNGFGAAGGSAKNAGVSGGGGYTGYTDYAGNHAHSVSIGAHSHGVSVAAEGSLENTIKNRKFNWIVRLA